MATMSRVHAVLLLVALLAVSSQALLGEKKCGENACNKCCIQEQSITAASNNPKDCMSLTKGYHVVLDGCKVSVKGCVSIKTKVQSLMLSVNATFKGMQHSKNNINVCEAALSKNKDTKEALEMMDNIGLNFSNCNEIQPETICGRDLTPQTPKESKFIGMAAGKSSADIKYVLNGDTVCKYSASVTIGCDPAIG